MEKKSLVERLLSRIEMPTFPSAEKNVKVKNTTPRKQPHAGYFHTSTVVREKDGVLFVQGVTYRK